MRVLVTGGSGYFGSLLIEKLLQNGFQVGSLDINKPTAQEKDIEFHRVDVRDKNSLFQHTKNYDIIFHNVAQVPLAKNKILFKQVNIDGTSNICEAALKNNIGKIVYTSSSAIYGVPQKNPVDENTVPLPGEEYGLAKLQGEKICEKFSRKGLSVSIIRPRTILGHGRLGIFSILFQWLSEGVNIPVLNNGNNIYQFIHADDLADAIILSANINKSLSFYNIGSDGYGTMRKTLEELCEYAGTGSKVYSLPLKPIEILMNLTSFLGLSPLGPYHSLMYGRSLYFNIQKAKDELGFSPKHDSNKMLSESYNWFLENKNNLNNNQNDLSSHKKPTPESILFILRLLSKYF